MLKRFVPAAVICLGVTVSYAQDSSVVHEEESIVVEQTLGDIVPEGDSSVDGETTIDSQSPVDNETGDKSSRSESRASNSNVNGDKPLNLDVSTEAELVEESDEMIVGEEDLFIISGEEESILSSEPSDVKKTQPHAQTDSVDEASLPSSEGKSAETTPVQTVPSRKVTRPTKKTPDLPGKSVSGPEDQESGDEIEPVIESARSINFAKNANEYRSPKKAMLFSLLLPGLGQAYVKRYVKSALFGIAEATIIGVAVNYHLKGNDQKSRARKFADNNYDRDKFNRFYENMEAHLNSSYGDDYDDILEYIFYDSTLVRRGAKNDNYYQALERAPYVQGWNDAEPEFNDQYDSDGLRSDGTPYKYIYESYGSEDTTWLVNRKDRETDEILETGIYGYSDKQNVYKDMVSDANGYYNVSNNMLFLLLANHIVSAVDALLSAKAHNDALLERESFWQRIHLDQQWAFTGSDLKTSLGINIRF